MSIYSFLYVQLHAVTIIYNVSGYRLSQPFIIPHERDFYAKSLAMKEKIANFAGDLEVP